MSKIRHEIIYTGSVEELYEGAFATVLAEITDIRTDQGLADGDPYEGSWRAPIMGVPSDVTLISPNSNSWTAKIVLEGADDASTYQYDSQSGTVLYRPGGSHDEEQGQIPRNDIGADLLSKLHEGLYGFFD